MTGGECRYWSIARMANSPDQVYPAILYGCLMDDEIVTDRDGRYVIIYSSKKDRPKNAVPEAGVTWQDWGPMSSQVLDIRWMSVWPDWHLPAYAPDERRISWAKKSGRSRGMISNWSERTSPGY